MTPRNLNVSIIGAGFIGKHLLRTLLSQGCQVRVLDRNPCPDEFRGAAIWVQGDFHDSRNLLHVLEGANLAYHLISSTVPGDQHIDIALELHENVVGSLRFVEACTEQQVGRVVFASSASVYGIQKNFPVSEFAPTWPISAHGIHKLAIEKYLWLAHWELGLDVRLLRLANPYGPGQSLSGRQGFIAIAIGCLLRGETLTLRNDGNMVRDFVYVEDVADALAAAGIMDKVPLLLNLGSGEGHSLREIVDLIQELAGRAINTASDVPRRVDIPISVLDVSAAMKSIAYLPKFTLRVGIANTLKANGVPLVAEY